ncbi:ornithine cyclodeaminase family protein [Vibrio alginolyticus]|uniref:ornithine cyclodeaminase family protein n=1 Tax=Vibrio alginolyticus TaxID=663 RepID=UPI00215CC4B1|nr:ornithine cyclodeaminase family protein [Vibrio alginolyticus]MCR9412941.1 ornithine cyclodeaminase family protein [Vibrio alginolyticus]
MMVIVPLKDIKPLVSFPEAIESVRDAFMSFSEGLVSQPQPMQMLFNESDGSFFGDCHVKAAQKGQHPYYVIKIASGFYKNTEKSLPANSGLSLVMSSETGRPVAMLNDDGWLTQIRTAAAGALAASLKTVDKEACVGIIGTGTQAYWQASFITQHMGLKRIAVAGRSYDSSVELCERLNHDFDVTAVAMHSAKEVCQVSQILVTVTPATQPIVTKDDLPESLHIIAVGADSPGKNEIAPQIMADADYIVTDNHQQCLHHGDFGVAVREKLVKEDSDISLSHLLAGKNPEAGFALAKITVVDLTGIGAQDLAIASLVVDKLKCKDCLQ